MLIFLKKIKISVLCLSLLVLNTPSITWASEEPDYATVEDINSVKDSLNSLRGTASETNQYLIDISPIMNLVDGKIGWMFWFSVVGLVFLLCTCYRAGKIIDNQKEILKKLAAMGVSGAQQLQEVVTHGGGNDGSGRGSMNPLSMSGEAKSD